MVASEKKNAELFPHYLSMQDILTDSLLSSVLPGHLAQ